MKRILTTTLAAATVMAGFNTVSAQTPGAIIEAPQFVSISSEQPLPGTKLGITGANLPDSAWTWGAGGYDVPRIWNDWIEAYGLVYCH